MIQDNRASETWLRGLTRTIRLLLAAGAGSVLVGMSGALADGTLVVGDGSGSPLSHVHAIAAAKGFSEPGLSVSWMRFPTGTSLVEGIAAGKIQVGIAGDTPAMALIAGGTPAKIIAKQTDSSLAYALYAREDAGIKRPEDLYGKTIGMTFGSQAQALWISILKADGLDASKMKMVNLPPSGLQAAYQRGEIAGYVLWQPGAYMISKLRPTVRLQDPAKRYFPEESGPKHLNGFYTVVVASDKAIQEHADLLKSFLRLVDKTNKFITENPKESATIIANALKVDPKATEIVLEQTKHEMIIDSAFVTDLDAQANLLHKQGRFRSPPPAQLKGWLDFSIMKEAIPGSVKVQ